MRLPKQPIYQHPVPADAVVAKPHAIDLEWSSCSDCAHAWQPNFDESLLREIYKSHYYTPAPDGIGVQFRDEFIATLASFRLNEMPRVLLEIGASDGDVLAELKNRTNASHAYAFEPNEENARIARRRGLDVRERFFGRDAAAGSLEPVELIYARHVIEHVFDFEGFFMGLNAVAAPDADVVLETPSLDFHGAHGSIAPFHVEHVHVFALRSLTRLAALHGWGHRDSGVTPSGNLIASFKKGGSSERFPAPCLGGLQAKLTQRREDMRRLLAGRRLIFWGAGSAGIALATAIGREPDIWTDGNPNKIGKKFVGSTRQIVSPESAIAEASSSQFGDPIFVITSSFQDEILPRIRQLGWNGAIFDGTGHRL
ncbi:MAG TPA: class I SAM-dependent methyltransferase [Steroidobacteraceae bacterium]|nr:class I SAM-dependent methyltransferase [Steroidobacteraceae bacterium]